MPIYRDLDGNIIEEKSKWRDVLTPGPPPPPPSPGPRKPPEAASRLNMWFRLGVCISLLPITLPFIVKILVEIFAVTVADLLYLFLIFSISLLIGLLCSSSILHKLWSLIPVEEAKTTPGKTVGFLFIPIFNLYWNFIVFYGLVQALDSQTRRRGINNKKVSKGLCLGFCIFFTFNLLIVHLIVLSFCGVDDAFIEELAPSFIFFTVPTNVVLGIMMFRQIKNTGIALSNGDKHEGRVSLFDAVEKNAYETVGVLLKHGTSVNAGDNNGKTPLHNAAWVNARETAEVLLNAGAAINARDNDGKTPLHIAAWEKARETAEVLLNAGAAINTQDIQSKTPLHYAVEEYTIVNDPEAPLFLMPWAVVQRIAGDTSDLMSVWTAKENKSREAAEVLLNAGAAINTRDIQGKTPLHYAVEANFREIAEVLLNAGAAINTQDIQGKTPLHSAALFNAAQETAEVLLQHDANVNVKDHGGKTPLQYAVEEDARETAEVLRRYGGIE